MGIDWGLVATIAAPLVALVVGSFLTRRPVVTTYLGHVSSHRVDPVAEDPPYDVFTHSGRADKSFLGLLTVTSRLEP